MSDDVASYLAQDSDDDVRTIEGRLKKVIFASRLQETAITIDFARKALALAADTPTEKGELTPDIILNICATYYHTDVESICARTKKKEIAHIRHVTCYLMCEKLAIPLSAIGKALGGRDHTTIMNSRDKVIEMLRTRTKLRNEIDDLKAIIDKQ